MKQPYPLLLFTMYYFTAINIFLSVHHGINFKFHNYFIHTVPNTAGSESFTESHPILRKDKFNTLTYDNSLFLIGNSTHPWIIIRHTIIISFFLSSLAVSKITTCTLEVIPNRSLIKETHSESPSHRKSGPLVVFSSFA